VQFLAPDVYCFEELESGSGRKEDRPDEESDRIGFVADLIDIARRRAQREEARADRKEDPYPPADGARRPPGAALPRIEKRMELSRLTGCPARGKTRRRLIDAHARPFPAI